MPIFQRDIAAMREGFGAFTEKELMMIVKGELCEKFAFTFRTFDPPPARMKQAALTRLKREWKEQGFTAKEIKAKLVKNKLPLPKSSQQNPQKTNKKSRTSIHFLHFP